MRRAAGVGRDVMHASWQAPALLKVSTEWIGRLQVCLHPVIQSMNEQLPTLFLVLPVGHIEGANQKASHVSPAGCRVIPSSFPASDAARPHSRAGAHRCRRVDGRNGAGPCPMATCGAAMPSLTVSQSSNGSCRQCVSRHSRATRKCNTIHSLAGEQTGGGGQASVCSLTVGANNET